jgi:RNA recognition motif-containing protein
MQTQRASELRFFVGGVGMDATESQLRTAFAEIGVVLTQVELVLNRATGFKRGFAFVCVDSPCPGSATSAADVLERMQGATVNGRSSTVRFAAAARVRH